MIVNLCAALLSMTLVLVVPSSDDEGEDGSPCSGCAPEYSFSAQGPWGLPQLASTHITYTETLGPGTCGCPTPVCQETSPCSFAGHFKLKAPGHYDEVRTKQGGGPWGGWITPLPTNNSYAYGYAGSCGVGDRRDMWEFGINNDIGTVRIIVDMECKSCGGSCPE